MSYGQIIGEVRYVIRTSPYDPTRPCGHFMSDNVSTGTFTPFDVRRGLDIDGAMANVDRLERHAREGFEQALATAVRDAKEAIRVMAAPIGVDVQIHGGCVQDVTSDSPPHRRPINVSITETGVPNEEDRTSTFTCV